MKIINTYEIKDNFKDIKVIMNKIIDGGIKDD